MSNTGLKYLPGRFPQRLLGQLLDVNHTYFDIQVDWIRIPAFTIMIGRCFDGTVAIGFGRNRVIG
jgi:hypothetical protein